MILFPNAKINIGLKILRRRPDGYHDLASVFVPVGWCDILEITPAGTSAFRQTGIALDCPETDNIVIKALRALETETGRPLPPLEITLEKHIPFGAGLGGGSADAAFALRGVNDLLGLGLDKATLAKIAAKVGADCPFFIYNTPMLASGTGDVLEPVEIPGLKGKYIVIVKPQAQTVSTKEAYSGVTPSGNVEPTDLVRAVCRPVEEWGSPAVLTNDFEPSVFARRPTVAAVKERMATLGALYTAMSGSGAAVFGIFDDEAAAARAKAAFEDCEVFSERF